MELKRALSKYLIQLKAEGRSDHTAGPYHRHVTFLASWLHDNGRTDAVEEIEHEKLAQFLSSPNAGAGELPVLDCTA